MNLVTFGCSWMFGVGTNYTPGMSKIEYKQGKDNHDAKFGDKYAFRKHLADKWECTNENFAQMGSSNERQFRFAERYFGKLDPSEYKNTVVLWALTVTTRTEVLSKEKGKYINVLFGNGWGADTQMERAKFDSKAHLAHHYDHKEKVELLGHKCRFWNRFFEAAGIENYWFDTFNHHEYPKPIDRMLFDDQPRRDLMSLKCADLQFSPKADGYHVSQFSSSDSTRIQYLEQQQQVNPFSQHPTREYHEWIADKIDAEVARFR